MIRLVPKNCAITVAVAGLAWLAACGDPPTEPDNLAICPQPPDGYFEPVATSNSIASGNANEEGQLSFEIPHAAPGNLEVYASATSLTGAQTPSQRASVSFEDFIDVLPLDESLFYEPILVRYQLDYRLEVVGPEGYGARARIDFPEMFTSESPIIDSTFQSGSAIFEGTKVIDYQMHTMVPDTPSEQMLFQAGVDVFSYNENETVSARAEMSFRLVGIFDLDGEPFPVRAFCTASGWDWAPL